MTGSEPVPSKNPRNVRFCWSCSRKLRGKYAYEMEWHGELRIFHKVCAEELIGWKEKYEAENSSARTKL